MQIQSSRQLAALWAGALVIFFASAWASTALLPAPGAASGPPTSYYVGLVGLLAIGLALVLSWVWVSRVGPASPAARVALQVLLMLGMLLWLVAMVFPFL